MSRPTPARTSSLRPTIHPYLSGNFAPIHSEQILEPCEIVAGALPQELAGGCYVRNGGNPAYPPGSDVEIPEQLTAGSPPGRRAKAKGRHYHWFDGDGMLHGVHFPSANADDPRPTFTNRQLATPVLTLSLALLGSPLPSISLLIAPLSSLHRIIAAIAQTFLLAVQASVGTLSVANTNVVWWGRGLGTEAKEQRDPSSPLDQRLLALCESGPPLEVRLPGLETVGWDKLRDSVTSSGLDEGPDGRKARWYSWRRWGLPALQEDWMTAHPRVDPVNGDLVFFSCQMFAKPYVRYSVIDREGRHKVWKMGVDVGKAKMMHDFGCSRSSTVIMNLPLTLTPLNMFSWKPRPMIHFDRSLPSEFIILPRDGRSHPPIAFRDKDPCMIFHTANTWDDKTDGGESCVDMLGCRFASAKLVYAAGSVMAPPEEVRAGFDDVVRLHYYRFDLSTGKIAHSFPLSTIPFEFPATHPGMVMQRARFVYGCTMREGGFDERLGGAAKVDCLIKLDVVELSERGRRFGNGIKQAVDSRSVAEILQSVDGGSIQVFALPLGWFAQEASFVPRIHAKSEDDGYLLTYVFDEGTYIQRDGSPLPDAQSELWVIDAKRMHQGMDAVVCRILLPQRVPYGLHGTWVPAEKVAGQRSLEEPLPPQPLLLDKMYRSRLNHFVDVFSYRNSTRDKSLGEKVAFHIMFPLSCIMLVLALNDVLHVWAASGSAPAWIVNMLDILGRESPKLAIAVKTFPWPQFATALLVITTLFYIGASKRTDDTTVDA